MAPTSLVQGCALGELRSCLLIVFWGSGFGFGNHGADYAVLRVSRKEEEPRSVGGPEHVVLMYIVSHYKPEPLIC